MAKRHEMPTSLEVQGARGGSFVRLSRTDNEERVHVEVGHSCVITVKQEIPVTWLAAILTHAKDIGFSSAMGDREQFPADYALICDPEAA